jgi:hypothetical protein
MKESHALFIIVNVWAVGAMLAQNVIVFCACFAASLAFLFLHRKLVRAEREYEEAEAEAAEGSDDMRRLPDRLGTLAAAAAGITKESTAPYVLTLGHRLWQADDPGLPANLRKYVVEGGLSVCRNCGAAEVQLEMPCPHPKEGK